MKDYNLLMEKVREYQMILNGVEEVLNNAVKKNDYIIELGREFDPKDFTEEDIKLFNEINGQRVRVKNLMEEI